jgi:hypothetical protein
MISKQDESRGHYTPKASNRFMIKFSFSNQNREIGGFLFILSNQMSEF